MSSESAPATPANLKILLIGDSSVGKSSLLLRFADQSFLSEEEGSTTIGVDFKVQRIEVDGTKYKLSIWDTAGQERFRTITSSYYRGAQGVILVYDVSNRESFDDLPRWINEIDTYCGPSVAKVIVGNKIDKEFSRRVPTTEGQAYADRMESMFLEASAKRGIAVDDVFQTVVRKIVATPELWQKHKPGTANVNTMPGAGVKLEAKGPVDESPCMC
ncbi:ras-domain-containing protein [Calocera cornea HHB12733]|uniref:Ras-domain-containing protein n=1 Tax=Calocera cornea HHB12733 TaxID=1353952 RepID=A0A165D2T3_9BASI|nr:ras-domain-containing protein [Calocera cornea HHB12733]